MGGDLEERELQTAAPRRLKLDCLAFTASEGCNSVGEHRDLRVGPLACYSPLLVIYRRDFVYLAELVHIDYSVVVLKVERCKGKHLAVLGVVSGID